MTDRAFAPHATVFALALALMAGCTEVPATTDHSREAEENGTVRKVCGVGIGPEQRRLKLDDYENRHHFAPNGIFFTATDENEKRIDPKKGFPNLKSSFNKETGRSVNMAVQMHGTEANCFYEIVGFHFDVWGYADDVGPAGRDLKADSEFIFRIFNQGKESFPESVSIFVLKDRVFIRRP